MSKEQFFTAPQEPFVQGQGVWGTLKWGDGSLSDMPIHDIIVYAANCHLCETGGKTPDGGHLWNIVHRLDIYELDRRN